RHVSPTVMLRSHTTAGIPALLDSLAPELGHYDVLHALPGLVYRRDQADKTHVGTPHQVDLWRLRARTPVSVADLHELMEIVVSAVLPGAKWRAVPTGHLYTVHGHQLDVWVDSHWLELAECGLIAAHILRAANLETLHWGGLAMGIGLDRALMLRKGIDDIRLLRSTRADVVAQLHDLKPWRPVTVMPAMRRDLSVLCSAGTDVEVLGDLARTALGASADLLQSLTVLSDTPAAYLAESARQRLQPSLGQHNVLIRLELASLDRTLTAGEANRLRDEVYLAIHQGPVKELIAV
ncbi:MAG: hypothetical protein HIU81_06125, partial [Acidobacteria bacterium]|nr:hypothetical protein [Acidobacteriota bacterium]